MPQSLKTAVQVWHETVMCMLMHEVEVLEFVLPSQILACKQRQTAMPHEHISDHAWKPQRDEQRDKT